MQVNINSVHFKADSRLENFIREKVQKVTRFHDGIIGGDVTLKVENTDVPENKVVEIRLKVKGSELISSKQCRTFEEATDLAADALRSQVKKVKRINNRTDRVGRVVLSKIEDTEEIDEEIE